MGNRNKIKRSTKKKKFDMFDLFIILIFLAIDFIIVINFSSVKVNNKGLENKKVMMMQIKKVMDTPLELEWKNKEVQDEALKMQKYVLSLYGLLILMYIASKAKKDDFKGIEYGSADWAKPNDYKRFKNRDKIVVSNDIFLDPKDSENDNLNELDIGGPGSGKSFRKMKPTLMNMVGSYIITDPKGELYRDSKYFLEKNGYKVKVLNLDRPKFSNGYNPFRYLDLYGEGTLETDILSLVDTFMKNTSDPKKGGGDAFWDDASKALLSALSFYLVLEKEEDERNFENIFDMIRSAKPQDDDDDGELEDNNPLEILFNELAEQNPYHPGVKFYEVFKLAAKKTAKSILISLAVRLNIWIARDVCTLTSEDEMELEKIGIEKTAVFLIIPETNLTLKPIASMFYSQLFKILFYEADFRHNGALPILVTCLLDEFANIGEIPDFDLYIATMRSRNVCVNIVIQALSQLEKLYKECWETILGCCHVVNYLGTTDQKTLKYISEKLGKTTVKVDTRGHSKGKQSSTSENEGYISRNLMSTDELFTMDKLDSIVFIKGFRPFYCKKYDTPKHKLFKIVGSKWNPNYCTDIKTVFSDVAVEREKKYEMKLLKAEEKKQMQLENKLLKLQLEEMAVQADIEKQVEFSFKGIKD